LDLIADQSQLADIRAALVADYIKRKLFEDENSRDQSFSTFVANLSEDVRTVVQRGTSTMQA
jgi:hypothetical protein